MNTLNLLSDSKYFDESNTKMAELRTLLDSKHMKEKLDAMKRLTAMMSIGRDMSAFFPDVVRNVIVESQEVKKLVYMFLITYAETNQDLALLSINTFQKDLASPSQRIRASAMKAMSSIRIPVAVPLVTLALKSAIKDTSSYVKRAAACAIPKVYALDTEQEEMLVEMISELLSNSDPLVIGPAMYAFQEVCPNNWDLIHPHFRKIVHLIADFDEWGQIVTLNVLTRYARTQFLSPFDKEIKEEEEQAKNPKKAKKERAFYSDDEESEEDDEEEDEEKEESDEYVMDEDHSLLLKQAATLLQSPNSGVILALASMYWNLAPSHQCAAVVKPLVRMSRNRRSLQFVILHAIVSMAPQRPILFRPFLKDFFIHSTDAYYVKALKLEILASIATEASIQAILKEFNAYAHDPDKEFVCQTLQALGRCANALPEIAERCMGTLMKLVTSPSEQVVAQAVVTIRQLLQNNADLHGSVVKKIAKLLDKVKIPMARTAIVWIIGEYRDKIPLLAPDCLRLLCKTFKEESDAVKEQILNLAVKLFLSNPKQTSLLFKYIMDLCKFDSNYDLRDRARLMRALFFKKKETTTTTTTGGHVKELPSLVKDAVKSVLLTEKPAPIVIAPFAGREKYILGTMSQTLNIPVPGYTDLPEFPKEQPDPAVRKPIVPEYEQDAAKKDKKKHRGSDSESDSESGDSDDSEFSSFNSESDSDSDSDSDSGSGSDSGSDDDSDDDKAKTKKKAADSDDDSESGSDDDDDSDDSDDGGAAAKKKAKAAAAEKAKEKEREKAAKEKAKEEESKRKKDEKDKKKKGNSAAAAAPSPAADLLDLQGFDDSSAVASSSPTQRDMTPLDTFFTPSASSTASQAQSPTAAATLSPSSATALVGVKQPALGQRGQLLNPINSGGLQIDYIMSRKPSLYDKKMVAIDLLLLNQSTAPFDEISMSEEADEKASGDSRGLDEVGSRPLNVGESAECKVHVNFKGKPMPRQLVVTIKGSRHIVKLTPSVGELVRPSLLSWTIFSDKQKKLGGMSEHQLSVNVNDINAIPQRVIDAVNVAALAMPTGTTDVYRFSGQSLHDDSSLLIQITIKKRDDSNNNKGATQIIINHDDFLFASNMTDTVKKAIAQ